MDEAVVAKNKDELFYAVGKLLYRKDIDEVMPVLITAVARALVLDANGDMEKLERQFYRFAELVRSQTADMILQDLDEAREATKQ
jgi:hypothetical protein